MRHEDLTKNHIIERWVYANAAARTTAAGFGSGDVGKVAYQSDTGQYWRLTNTAPTWQPLDTAEAHVYATPANPTGTTNTAGVMMGIGQPFTPIATGKVFVMFTGSITNTGLGNGGKVQVRYGSGSAPANGAALAGTALGNIPQMVNPSAGGVIKTPFCIGAIITGLMLQTPYWFDLMLAAIVGGTVAISDITASVMEL